VKLDDFRQAVAGDDPELRFLFSNYFFRPGVALAHREAREKR
jgi:hypothetical protein